jgi:hypothetical protein
LCSNEDVVFEVLKEKSFSTWVLANTLASFCLIPAHPLVQCVSDPHFFPCKFHIKSVPDPALKLPLCGRFRSKTGNRYTFITAITCNGHPPNGRKCSFGCAVIIGRRRLPKPTTNGFILVLTGFIFISVRLLPCIGPTSQPGAGGAVKLKLKRGGLIQHCRAPWSMVYCATTLCLCSGVPLFRRSKPLKAPAIPPFTWLFLRNVPVDRAVNLPLFVTSPICATVTSSAMALS